MNSWNIKKLLLKITIVNSLLLVVFSCDSGNAKGEKELSGSEINSVFTGVNKTLLQSENEDIDDYIARHKWNMITTSSGLRYEIYQKNNNIKTKRGHIITLNYELRLINNYLCYSSKNDGQKVFMLGKSDETRGLEEAISLMRKGEKARLIVPSHLGYGLLGDHNEIPKKAILIYDIELIDLK